MDFKWWIWTFDFDQFDESRVLIPIYFILHQNNSFSFHGLCWLIKFILEYLFYGSLYWNLFIFFYFEMLYSSWQGVVQDLWKILWPLDSTLVSKSLWESMERNKILVTNYPIIYCFKVAGMAKKFQIFSSNWWSYCSLFLPTWFEVGAICLS